MKSLIIAIVILILYFWIGIFLYTKEKNIEIPCRNDMQCEGTYPLPELD